MLIKEMLKEIEEIITPHLFDWYDTCYMSDGKLETITRQACFLCGYKFTITHGNFKIECVNGKNKQRNGNWYYEVNELIDVKKCYDILKKYDFTRLNKFEEERFKNNLLRKSKITTTSLNNDIFHKSTEDN